MKNQWDQRYDKSEYVYGKEPNDFLKDHFAHIPKGRVLFLAEGEGRNAVFLAKQPGYEVTAMDSSEVGMKKAQELAQQEGVNIKTVVADLNDFDLGDEQWDGIVSIFCHLPAPLRRRVHAGIVRGLKKGGVLLSEAYTPNQLEYQTGGPKSEEMLVDKAAILEELAGLRFDHLNEAIREVHEGQLHFGKGAVIQVIAIKK